MKLTRYREFESFEPQPGVRLLAFESDRFKTVRARVYLLEPIKAVIATENALLARVLNSATALHPSRRELARACEELYGATLGAGITRFGDAQAVVATIDFPADRFLPKGSKELEGAVALLAELVTQPALSPDGSTLRADLVEQEKYQLENELRAMEDDKPTWAAWLASQRTYAGTPACIHESGRLEDLPAITPSRLMQRHQSLLGNSQVVAVVTGPARPEQSLHVMAAELKLPKSVRSSLPATRKLGKRKFPLREQMGSPGEQTHLVFAWSGGAVYGKPGFAAMLYADSLFGGYGMNRLFKIVREQHGLAYSVYSQYHRTRGTIVAQAAVDPKRADKAVALIRSEFARLQDEFSNEEFAAVRESLIESRKSAWDSQSARVTDAVFQIVVGFKQSIEQQLRDIRAVKPEQVRAVLKAMKPHSEFRLG